MTLRTRVARYVAVVFSAATVALVAVTSPAVALVPPSFVTAWGTAGTGNSEFTLPSGIAVDSTGNVYVVDADRVQKFTSTGSYLTQWGTAGPGNGQFNDPSGVAVDRRDDTVYVADTWNNRIQKFTSTGSYLTEWGTRGSDEGQFTYPNGVAVDPTSGDVYVSDPGNGRIQAFTSTGAFLTTWDAPGYGWAGSPEGVAVDADGNVYVVESSGNDPFPGNVQRVEKFTPTGTFLLRWGGFGTGAGQFVFPQGVAVDGDDHVYVVDSGNHRMQEFTSTGGHLTQWGGAGTANGQFRFPVSAVVDATGEVYVVDGDNHRVQEFRNRPRPDGRINQGAGAYKGEDLYNTTGTGQTKRASAARGSSVTYHVSVQNDAAIADALRVKGTATNSRFKVTYTVGGTDVTGEIVAGAYTTPALPPGSEVTVTVVVRVKGTAPVGSSLTGNLIVKSDADPTLRDTVKFVTRRA